jgi:hypothetical protein
MRNNFEIDIPQRVGFEEYAEHLINRLISMSDDDADNLPLILVEQRNELLGRNSKRQPERIEENTSETPKRKFAKSFFGNSDQPSLFTAEHYK